MTKTTPIKSRAWPFKAIATNNITNPIKVTIKVLFTSFTGFLAVFIAVLAVKVSV